jgi:hypothetical protein
MKRVLTLMIFVVSLAMSASAQKGLHINAIFDGRYADLPEATEIMISGDQLRSYNLTLYHSLTLVDSPKEAARIEALVARDGAHARQREVAYRDGGLYYGFYQLQGINPNRYLFFLNQHRAKGNKIVVIYIEGSAGIDKIKSMLK